LKAVDGSGDDARRCRDGLLGSPEDSLPCVWSEVSTAGERMSDAAIDGGGDGCRPTREHRGGAREQTEPSEKSRPLSPRIPLSMAEVLLARGCRWWVSQSRVGDRGEGFLVHGEK
jgi:hypothetical protein